MEGSLAAFSDFLTAGLRLSRATVAAYLLEARLLGAWCRENGTEPEGVGAADLVEYLVHRQLVGASRRTTAKSLSALRCYFRFLRREGRLTGDPTEHL